MHSILPLLATAWGLLTGAATSRVPWRRWFPEPGEGVASNAEPSAAASSATALSAAEPRTVVPFALLAGLLCLALALRLGPRPEVAVWLGLVPVGLLIARIDLAERRLPDRLTLPAVGGTAVLLGGAALLPGARGSWPGALLGAVALAGVYLVLVLAHPAGLGLGDVKLAGLLGLALGWYGWPCVLLGGMLPWILGALTVLPLLLLRRVGRRTYLPFGPFMLLGALGAVLFSAR